MGKFLIAIELHAKSSFERRCAPIFGVQAASVESSTTVADDTGPDFRMVAGAARQSRLRL